jgi:hypothetical protein
VKDKFYRALDAELKRVAASNNSNNKEGVGASAASGITAAMSSTDKSERSLSLSGSTNISAAGGTSKLKMKISITKDDISGLIMQRRDNQSTEGSSDLTSAEINQYNTAYADLNRAQNIWLKDNMRWILNSVKEHFLVNSFGKTMQYRQCSEQL